MKTLAISVAAFSILGLSNVPVSAEPVSTELTGSSSTTGVSGIGGTNRTLSKSASLNQAIYGADIAERSDDPCFLRLKYRDVATGSTGSSQRFAECDDNNNDEGTNSSLRYLSLPAGAFVTGARICLNSDRDKLKGLQLIGTYGACLLGEDKVYVATAPCSNTFKAGGQEYRICDPDQPSYVALDCRSAGVSDHVERTNCPGTKRGPDADWESVVSCPDRMAATGMQLSTRDSGGGRTMIDGVALVCHRMELPG
jgi:hypothetical protein